MPNNPLENSQKQSYTLVEFEYGDPSSPSYARFTNWPVDPGTFGNNWTPTTNMGVRLGPDTAAFSETPTVITLNTDNSFIDTLSKGEIQTTTRVKIWLVFIGQESSIDPIAVFVGRVLKTLRNVQGQKGVVELECVNWKREVDYDLGIPADLQCAWTFADPKTCKFIGDYTETGSITVIDGTTVTITGLADKSAGSGALFESDRYWHRGFVESGGLRIPIREWNGNVSLTNFELARRPPASWRDNLPLAVTVYGGCHKTYARCQEWEQEDRFMGAGFAMPAYDPRLDDPRGS